MLSAGELGRRVTSVRYRKLLADYYATPPDALFAHQDAQLAAVEETPRLLVGHRDLRATLTDTPATPNSISPPRGPVPKTRTT